MTWPLIHVSDLIFHPSLPGPLCSSHTGFMLALFTCRWASGLASSAKMLSSWNMVPLPTPQASTLRSPSQKRLPEPPKLTTPPHTHYPPTLLYFSLYLKLHIYFFLSFQNISSTRQRLCLFHYYKSVSYIIGAKHLLKEYVNYFSIPKFLKDGYMLFII